MNRSLVFVVLLAACHHPSDAGPTSFEPVLSSRDLWSGGELLLMEPWFRNADAIVVLGSDTLTPTRLNDTTFLLTVPVQPLDTVSIRVIAGDQAASLGNVVVHGFEDGRLGPSMSGQPYWLPNGGAPLVFAGANSGAAIVDLRTLTPVYSLPDSISSPDCMWSPSPTHRSDRFVLMGRRANGTCDFPRLWSLTQPPQMLDSIACCGSEWYTSGQPSPGRWIFNRNNQNYFYVCDTQCVQSYFLSGDGPDGVTISPRGDRFLWKSAERPVIRDSRTLDTAWVLSGYSGLQGAFSFDGDTLAVTAYEQGVFGAHLLVLRSDDGTILRDVRLDTLGIDSVWSGGPIAFDPVRPWLYVTAYRRSWTDTSTATIIFVFDRESWKTLGVLRADRSPAYYVASAVVPSPVEHRVYLVTTANGDNMHGYPGVVLRYSTP